MPELLALTRMSIVHCRRLMLMMLAAVATGAVTALVVGPVGDDELGGKIASVMLFCTLMPAALSSIVLFDYSSEGNMNLPESGCSHWILRMPVQSWKVALVPLVLKTIWVTGLYSVFLLVVRRLGAQDEIPLISPSICLSATVIWVLVLAWRPFRRGWHRVAGLCIAVPVLYACVVAVFVTPNLKIVEWRATAMYATYVAVTLLYVSGALLAVHSVRLARTSITGVIPELGGRRQGVGLAGVDDRVRHFRSPMHTLLHHEMTQARGWVRNTFLVGVIPAIILFALFVPLTPVSVGAAFYVFFNLAAISVSRGGQFQHSTFSPHLAASPLSDAKIAWAKSVTPMVTAALVFSSVLVLFALWSVWPENRAAWIQWASLRARDVGTADPVMIGVRWSAAIVIVTGTIAAGRLAGYLWVAMAGRSWLTVVMAVMTGLMILVVIGVLCRWIMLQKDWESAEASAWWYASFVPTIVGVLLGLKGVALVATCIATINSTITSNATVVRGVAIWASLTLAIATTTAMLIPDPRASFGWCLAITALSIPISRVLVLPIALAWNRHR